MTLLWDGLRVAIPAGMEPAVLDRGFVRLAEAGLPALDLRFGPAKKAFDPLRDGRRLLKASGLGEGKLAAFRPSWPEDGGKAIWSEDGPKPRLYVLDFGSRRGLAAALFASPPTPGLVREVLESLDWIPLDAWRPWRCFDLSFETPPGAALTRASFRPGVFRIEFLLGSTSFVVERLAPADVLLDGADLESWLDARVRREHGPGLSVAADGRSRARFSRPSPPWRRLLPWLAADRLAGGARHDAAANRILMLTQRGRPLPDPDFERIFPSHAVA